MGISGAKKENSIKDLIFCWRALPFFVGVFFYLVYKFGTLSIRLSDSNIYFVTASHLAKGEILYRDIFFTNFPLLPYLSVLYYWMLGGNLKMYFFTSAIETSVVALLIFYVLLREGKSYLLATISSFVYIFSVLVLITTDHQTGVFLASLFAVLSYMFLKSEKYFWVGVMCALMFLVKAYFIPIALTIGVYLFLKKKWKYFLYFAGGGVGAGVIILLPIFILAGEEMVAQIFGYSLSRGAGIPKFEIAKFYIFRDFLFFGILIFNLVNIKKRLFWGLFSVFSLAFFFFYQDIYYLYLNFTAPFAALSFPYLYQDMQEKVKMHVFTIPTILGLLFLWNIYVSYSGFYSLGRIETIDEIAEIVREQEAEYVYGNNDIAPAISYLSGTPQLNNIVDTNENMFRSGALDASTLTSDILKNKTVLVLHSAYYPMLGIENDTFSEIVVGEKIQQNCRLLKRFPVVAEGVTNGLAVFRCF